MGVYLLGQLYHAGVVLPLFITFLIRLLLGRGLNERIIRQGYLIRVLKDRRFEKTDGIHGCHPTFQKLKPPSLEDDHTYRILSVIEPHVVENLLAHLHGFLQVSKLLISG